VIEVRPEGCVPIKAWVDGVQFEEKARQQVQSIAGSPFPGDPAGTQERGVWARLPRPLPSIAAEG
jgi:hypothetical protein